MFQPRYSLLASCNAAILTAALTLSSSTIATAAIKNWIGGTGNWSTPGNWNGGSVPLVGDTVNITPTDGIDRTVTYDTSAPTLGVLSVDLTGPGATTTTFEMPGNNLTTNGVLVGLNGRATFNQSGGTTTTINDFDLGVGLYAGSSGAYNLSNAGTLSVSGSEYIGSFGNGTFTQSGGTNTTSNDLYVGASAGGNGLYTLSAGSLSADHDVFIGNYGSGTLRIENGAVAGGRVVNIGRYAGSDGIVTVTGAGSYFGQYDLIVGDLGAGTLNVEDGASVNPLFGSIIGYGIGGTGEATVTGANSTWAANSELFVGAAGVGTLTIAEGGAVVVYLQFGTRLVSINNSASTLNIGAGGTSGTIDAAEVVNNGTLNFNHTDSITFSTPISGAGQITKLGSGSTTITDVGGFTGSFLASGGQLNLTGQLSSTNYSSTVDGTLRFDGSTVNLGSSGMIRSAAAVEYNANTVNGGFLRGPGTHTIVSGSDSAYFNGVTTYNSVDLIQDGIATFTNFTNGGRLTNNTPLNVDGGANTSSGVIIVNDHFNTREFTNNGVISVSPGGIISHDTGHLVSGGGSRTSVDTGGTMDLLLGSALDLNGALLVNNGTINGTTNVYFGSVAKGSGNYGTVNVFDGGTFSPGNSPGAATLESASFNSGGRYIFEIGDADGLPGIGYDVTNIQGTLAVDAGSTPNSQFTVTIASLDAFNQPGLAQNFDPTQSYSFVLASAGAGITGFSATEFILDAANFQNDMLGGGFFVSQSGNDLLLNFAAAPVLLGDYNQDGTVDAADYTVWRDNLGSLTMLPNDDTAGVDFDDYDRWKAHFGQSSGSGSSALGSAEGLPVPEPPSAFFLLAAAVTIRALVQHARTGVRRSEWHARRLSTQSG